MVQQSLVSRPTRRLPGRPAIVAATVAVAVLVNVVISTAGRAAGGSFRFTTQSGPAEVDVLTVVGFTVVPLLVGMTVVALLVRVWPWVVTVALFVAPALALTTIPLMTLPAAFDATSTVTLALCHVALVPTTVLGLLALRAASGGRL
ncbi:DUF6069 family protein [Agromyces albus]|uniref:DUF6069 family protein n=1 Tax=Agromyces albus TaxID=205332 RepID=UPI002781F2DA|nr:DUF6069 family protein [Agromyces albus]MDQ0577019.1 hypothetical protein [Agromyces albus]